MQQAFEAHQIMITNSKKSCMFQIDPCKGKKVNNLLHIYLNIDNNPQRAFSLFAISTKNHNKKGEDGAKDILPKRKRTVQALLQGKINKNKKKPKMTQAQKEGEEIH